MSDSGLPLSLLVPVFVNEVGCVDDHTNTLPVRKKHHLAAPLEPGGSTKQEEVESGS